MNKIILVDGTILTFSKIEGLEVNFNDKTIEDLEKVFTKDNCKKIQLTTSTGEVYATYNNVECVSITKKLDDNTITVNLSQLSDLNAIVNDLQDTVDKLVMGEVM